MTNQHDFERIWLARLTRCLDEIVSEDIRKQVMVGSDALSAETDRGTIITWSQEAMARLESLVPEVQRKQVMTGCACHYPKDGLQDVRAKYEETGDIAAAHQMLQTKFESFLRDSLALDETQIVEIVSRGWGLAGVLRDDVIIATKIPKSGYLLEYLQETDPEKRRQVYCHCPRVRDAVAMGETLSTTYCYCGAGFYRGIWEEILQHSVDVEVLESVLAGGDVCKIAIRF